MQRGKRLLPQQIIAILRRRESGETAEAVCRSVNISESTLYRWKQQYGPLELSKVKALREENALLRRVVADQVLKEVNAKVVSSSQKRHAAQGVVGAPLGSRRQAYRYLGLARSSCAYRPRPPTERRVRTEAAIVALSRRYPRYGYRRIHVLVERQGHRCARRTVQRIRRQEGFRVAGPSRRPKCPSRPEAKIRPEGFNDVWCLELVFDVTTSGTTIKFLAIIDEGCHYCIDIFASQQLGAAEVIRALQAAIAVHGTPWLLRCDKGG
jgi:putative transposase